MKPAPARVRRLRATIIYTVPADQYSGLDCESRLIALYLNSHHDRTVKSIKLELAKWGSGKRNNWNKSSINTSKYSSTNNDHSNIKRFIDLKDMKA